MADQHYISGLCAETPFHYTPYICQPICFLAGFPFVPMIQIAREMMKEDHHNHNDRYRIIVLFLECVIGITAGLGHALGSLQFGVPSYMTLAILVSMIAVHSCDYEILCLGVIPSVYILGTAFDTQISVLLLVLCIAYQQAKRCSEMQRVSANHWRFFAAGLCAVIVLYLDRNHCGKIKWHILHDLTHNYLFYIFNKVSFEFRGGNSKCRV